MSGTSSETLRIGLDVVAVDEVARSVERFGDRYVRRIFTDHEIACCRRAGRGGGATPPYAMDSLAARFAAKEAVIKVLRPVEGQPEWRSIELHRMTGGWCEIHLSGLAADLAVEAGIDEFSVSVSHEADFAAAVVVGRCTQEERGER
ncbi:MAG: holo-ACP synthase [Acidimicrobiales bacterium]|jgi:holo-[acyl-carrier protein] synthase